MSALTPWSLRLGAPESARSGGRVRFTLTLTNDSAEPADFYLRGRDIAFDITVAGVDEAIVWRRLQGEILPAIVQIRGLAPHEKMEMHAQWDLRRNDGTRVPPGDYTVRGFLLTESDPLESPPIPLRIENP